MVNTGDVRNKVRALAEALGVEWEIVESGRDVIKKGQRIIKTIRYTAFSLRTLDEILKEYGDLRKKYDFSKLVYRVSTAGGHSRMYLVKFKKSK